ncbi:MAG: class I SAM-dependent methyltransferase [Pseudomonadota bacterium]
MKCIVCGSATRAGLSPWHAACPACLYESADLTPTINQQHAHELVNERDRETALKVLRQENFKAIVAHAGRLAAPGAASLLDVGSAHGWFLEEASARFKVLGIEPDAAVGEKAAARGLPVRYGYFPDALHSGEQFDVIVFNDVIEHIPAIGEAIAACHQRLTAAGILVLNLPSSRGFFYRLSKLFARIGLRGPFERMWQKDLPSPHVHYFNEKNLAALVGPQGFELVQGFELPSLRATGLMERLRFVGQVSKPVLYAQYLAVMCAIPVLSLFPSDIVVCIFRKR